MASDDRIHLEFTSDVSHAVRQRILEAVLEAAGDDDCYVYRAASKALSDTIHIDITAHDRTTFDLTDGQVVERLRPIAKAQGISVMELLRRLAQE